MAQVLLMFSRLLQWISIAFESSMLRTQFRIAQLPGHMHCTQTPHSRTQYRRFERNWIHCIPCQRLVLDSEPEKMTPTEISWLSLTRQHKFRLWSLRPPSSPKTPLQGYLMQQFTKQIIHMRTPHLEGLPLLHAFTCFYMQLLLTWLSIVCWDAFHSHWRRAAHSTCTCTSSHDCTTCSKLHSILGGV